MTKDHLNNVCRPGRGADTCSFLASNGGGFICAKLDDGLRGRIEFKRFTESMRAMGDNCEGDTDFLIVPSIADIASVARGAQ